MYVSPLFLFVWQQIDGFPQTQNKNKTSMTACLLTYFKTYSFIMLQKTHRLNNEDTTQTKTHKETQRHPCIIQNNSRTNTLTHTLTLTHTHTHTHTK